MVATTRSKKTSHKEATHGKQSRISPKTTVRAEKNDSANQAATGSLSAAHKIQARETLFRLISRTQPSSTICPSQVPRALHDSDKNAYPDWRALMEPVREMVWEEVKSGAVQVTQGGEVRPYDQRKELKGPIRVRRGKMWEERNADA